MTQSLRSLEVQGLTSMSSLTLDLTSDVTLIVGANGSGKSNIVSAFEFLGRIVDAQLNDHVLSRGGLGRLLHRSADPSTNAETIRIEAWGDWVGGLSNGYRADVSTAAGDRAVVDETTYFHDRRYPQAHDVGLGMSADGQLRDAAKASARARYVFNVMSGCRVFHFDDTSPDAPPKRRSDVADDLTLHPDARNLAPVLRSMSEDDPEHYHRIVRAVRSVAPFFDDFELQPSGDTTLLRWRERGIDGAFSADALSDGTLRFVCLATLLLQPNAPGTIVLDEPELGLHPFAIHQLAGLLRRAAEGRRIVAATQSVTLLEQFTVDEVAVVERSAAGTTVSRPERQHLEAWLDDYSLGDLWEKNVLGGRPRVEPRGR